MFTNTIQYSPYEQRHKLFKVNISHDINTFLLTDISMCTLMLCSMLAVLYVNPLQFAAPKGFVISAALCYHLLELE